MADDATIAFPTLDARELALLEALGTKRPTAAGEYLYREGDATYDFYVVLSGLVEIVAPIDGEERIITSHGRGRFVGELNLLTGQRAYLSALVVEPGEVIVVPGAGRLRRLGGAADPAARVTALDGDRVLRSVRLSNPEGDSVLHCVALFSFVGAEPSSAWLSGCAALDDGGFVLTDLSVNDEQLDERWMALDRRPLPFETSHPGLFAAGDIRAGSTKRVAAAVGEGSASVRSVHQYLAFVH